MNRRPFLLAAVAGAATLALAALPVIARAANTSRAIDSKINESGKGQVTATSADPKNPVEKPIRPLYLTMDDGYEHVETVIAETRALKIPVTFFPTGQALLAHPDAWRTLYADGHEFGCHTFNHAAASRLTVDQFRDQLRQWKAAATKVLGEKAVREIKYFRFPYGDSGGYRRAQFRKVVQEEFGWHIIGWDLSLSDVFPHGTASQHTPQQVAQQFNYRVGQSDVVLLHFVNPDYLTLPDLQEKAVKLHYRFARLSDHPKIDKAGVVGR